MRRTPMPKQANELWAIAWAFSRNHRPSHTGVVDAIPGPAVFFTTRCRSYPPRPSHGIRCWSPAQRYDQAVLRMYGARLVGPDDGPEFYQYGRPAPARRRASHADLGDRTLGAAECLRSRSQPQERRRARRCGRRKC